MTLKGQKFTERLNLGWHGYLVNYHPLHRPEADETENFKFQTVIILKYLINM